MTTNIKVYTPDKWVIVKVTKEGSPTHCKVLCEWGGSFTYGSSCKLSSPIVGVSIDNSTKAKTITFKTLTGSSYVVTDYMQMLGFTTSGVLNQMQELDEGGQVEVVPYQDIILFEEFVGE